jgi:hypothetical protein
MCERWVPASIIQGITGPLVFGGEAGAFAGDLGFAGDIAEFDGLKYRNLLDSLVVW